MKEGEDTMAADIKCIYQNHEERERCFAYAHEVFELTASQVRSALGAIELSLESSGGKCTEDVDRQCIESAIAEIKQAFGDHIDDFEVELEYERVSLRDVIEEAIDDCYHLLLQRNINVQRIFQDEDVHIFGDRKMLRQMCVHCFLFLASGVEDGASLIVASKALQQHLYLRLSINGKAISAPAKTPLSDLGICTGGRTFFDLSRSHKIADVHRGAINIRPEDLGNVIIDILLPRNLRLSDMKSNNISRDSFHA